MSVEIAQQILDVLKEIKQDIKETKQNLKEINNDVSRTKEGVAIMVDKRKELQDKKINVLNQRVLNIEARLQEKS